MSAITLAVVEDNKKMAKTISHILQEGGIRITGLFASAEEALERLPEGPPSILLVDLGLPGMDGVELIRRAKKDFPSLEIMVFTVFDEREKVFDSLKAGATGYILKDASPKEIIAAITELHKDGSPMSKKIAKYVLEEFREAAPSAGKTAMAAAYTLSGREKEVLQGLSQGLTYLEIAANLSLGPETIKTYIKKIYHKLQVNSKISAINKAMDQGLL